MATPADQQRLFYERQTGQQPSSSLQRSGGGYGAFVARYETPKGTTQVTPGFGGETLTTSSKPQGALAQLAQSAGPLAGMSGGGGNANVGYIDLDPFRRDQINAMERLLNLQFQGVSTELKGTIAQTKLTRDYDIANIQRNLRYQNEDTQASHLQRNTLDSGLYLRDKARVEGAAVEASSQATNMAAASIGSLQSQISLLGAQKAANIADQRAKIEWAYALARNAG